MRLVSQLSDEQRARLRRYVSRNADVSSRELAEDIQVNVATIAAWKAWDTRTVEGKFNTALAR